MSRNTVRWSASAAWVALTIAAFLFFDALDGLAVSRWLLAAGIALLPPAVVIGLLGQEQTSTAGRTLHVTDRRIT